MAVFSSMTELINYYNEKQTIPSRIAVTINGSVYEFKRSSTHNKNKISKGMIDNYTFVEDENCGYQLNFMCIITAFSKQNKL